MRNQIKTIILFGVLGALVVGFGALVAPGQIWFFLVLSLAMNLGAYFFSDRIVLRLHGAIEVTEAEAPDLHAVVAELAARAEIPKPRVCIIAEAQPNAFATGRNPKHGVVAVTEGLLGLLDARQLRGVLAHELAHIKNRDILVASVAAAVASLITHVAQMLTLGALFGGSAAEEEEGEGSGAAGGLLAMLVAPVAATIVQLAISRSREYLADERGARICGDPTALARALQRLERASGNIAPLQAAPATASLFIVNPFGSLGRLARLFSTHPSTEERVRRLLELAASSARAEVAAGVALQSPWTARGVASGRAE
jgi:heat shock protein HtpX